MKKILSVLCVLAFVASFACIGVSADAAAVSFAAVAEPVAPGATEFTVDIQATLPAGDDDASTVTQLNMFVDYPEELTLAAAPKKVFTDEGMYTFSQTTDVKPYNILWVSGTASLPTGATTTLVTLTFTCPAAEVGTTYDIAISLNPEDMPATIMSVTHENATATGCTVEVVEPVVTTTVTEPVTEPETSEPETSEPATQATDAPAPVVSSSETDAPVVSSSEVTTSTTESTKAPDKATQTGDMMFVVVAVMVVALGAAVVVKKVSVR